MRERVHVTVAMLYLAALIVMAHSRVGAFADKVRLLAGVATRPSTAPIGE